MKPMEPSSEEFRKPHGFTVPDGYFEQLPNRVMQRTAYASATFQTQPSWFWRFRTALAGVGMAAAFSAAFFTTKYYDQEQATLTPAASLAQVSQHEIYQYLVNETHVETADVAEVPSAPPVHEMEFIEVQHEDVNVEEAMEVLSEEYDSQPIIKNEE